MHYKYDLGDRVVLLNGAEIESELELEGRGRDGGCGFVNQMFDLIGSIGEITDRFESFGEYPCYQIEFDNGHIWNANEEWIEPEERHEFCNNNHELDSLFND